MDQTYRLYKLKELLFIVDIEDKIAPFQNIADIVDTYSKNMVSEAEYFGLRRGKFKRLIYAVLRGDESFSPKVRAFLRGLFIMSLIEKGITYKRIQDYWIPCYDDATGYQFKPTSCNYAVIVSRMPCHEKVLEEVETIGDVRRLTSPEVRIIKKLP